jgi:phage terminase large subunit GpA-like protein
LGSNLDFDTCIYGIKGMDGAAPIWPRCAGKIRKLPGSNVWAIGVDTAKDSIYSKLKVTAPGPGYCDFPIAYQQEFFNQLTSEKVCTLFVCGHPVRYWFKPSGKRNETLDRRVYALVALHSRPVPWEVLLRAAPTEPPPSPPEGGGAPAPSPSSPPPAPASRFERRRIRFRMK